MSAEKSANKKRTKISARKLLKFSGIMFVSIYAISILVSQQFALDDIEDIKSNSQARINSAELETKALEDELTKATNDPDYIKQAIRDNLGYVMPGERIYIDINQE